MSLSEEIGYIARRFGKEVKFNKEFGLAEVSVDVTEDESKFDEAVKKMREAIEELGKQGIILDSDSDIGDSRFYEFSCDEEKYTLILKKLFGDGGFHGL